MIFFIIPPNILLNARKHINKFNFKVRIYIYKFNCKI